MDTLTRAVELLTLRLGGEHRDTLLSAAFSQEHRALYDRIAQRGAPRDFTTTCVRLLLDHGRAGNRHALSLLLEAARLDAGVEWQAQFQALIDELDAGIDRAPDPSNPYRDLRAFQEEDAAYFFGRDAFTDELLAAVDRSPFVAVIGPSGSGKSSVVQAGLIPRLRARGGFEFGILRPGPEPWRSLAGCLLNLLEGEPAADRELARLNAIGELADQLAASGSSAVSPHHIVARILEQRPGAARLLLLVDQWEELYTYRHSSPNLAAGFTDALLEAIQRAPLAVVLTLRADFTGHALEHRALRDRAMERPVMLGPMTRAELAEAIEGPARKAGVDFEAGLVGRILDDVAEEPGGLPLLEFCLTRLYDRRRGNTLTQAAYEAIGRVPGAIVQRADAVVDDLAARRPEFGAAARDVFLRLVQLGEGTEDTRRRVNLDEWADGGTAREVLAELADARLLVTGRDPASGQDTVEVAHEALIRRWPRLRGWLEDDRDELRLRREMERAAALWDDHGREDSYRWADSRVMEAAPALRRLATRLPLSGRERDFIGPTDADDMLACLRRAETSHAERATIGDRLALLPGGDPRPGVGLSAEGLPDLVWHEIPGGEVELEIEAKGLWRRLRGRPRFTVEPFRIARHPVTVAQWRAFVEAADGYDAYGFVFRAKFGGEPARQRRPDNHPAVDVTWVEAMAYCEWLSVRLGYPVRLPTEWEWQQGATGGVPGNQYPWGKNWVDNRANTTESELGRIIAVGLYPAGAAVQGALDLTGNVWEWCLNRHDAIEELTQGGDRPRVVRGGA